MEIWVLLICMAILFVVRNTARMTSVVYAREVVRIDDAEDDLYECVFYWQGCKRYGYFFYEQGEPPEDLMLRVVGVDCEAGLWHLEVCDNE